MLYPAGRELDVNMTFERKFRFDYLDATEVDPFSEGLTVLGGFDDDSAPPPDKQLLETRCNGGSGTLLMFRDSFGNALHPFFADAFERAAFSRQMPYRLDWLDGNKVDVLAVEIVERNISDLAAKAPIMPAPRVPEEIGPVTESNTEVFIKTEETSDLDGMVKVSGVFPAEGITVDSPVYIETEEGTFEACPVGENRTEESECGCFTAYLPLAGKEDGILAVILKGENGWERLFFPALP